MKRITILAAAGALAVTPALGAWAAFASTGDAAHGTTTRTTQVRVDDRRHGAESEPGDDHGRHHRRHHADDTATHQRHGAEPEPGDDNGGHGTEPSDDNGGHGTEPGDDNGGSRHGGGDDGSGHH